MNSAVLSGLEVIKILKKAGFIAVRQKGSHVRLEKLGKNGLIKVTVPLHKELKKGTLIKIIKDSGLTQEEFERYR